MNGPLIAEVLTLLIPVFAIAALGFVYARFNTVSLSALSRLNMDVFSPALLFNVLSKQDFHFLGYQDLLCAAILITLGFGGVGMLLAKQLNVDKRTLVPSMMFANTGNVGVPMAFFAFGEPGLAIAIVLLVITAVLIYSLGIFIVSKNFTLLAMFKMPLIIAVCLGIGVNILELRIPLAMSKPIGMLSVCSIPIMLFLLGARLNDLSLTHWRLGFFVAFARPMLGGLLFLLIHPWFNLVHEQKSGLLLFAMLPPAIVNYLIAENYQQEPKKVAAIVLLGNFVTIITLPVALFLALSYFSPS